MCGLVGLLSSNIQLKHKEVLANLLYLDTWRGRDSTGVAAIRQNADTHILKSTIPGYEFTEGPKLFEHLKLNDFCWIGHNRYGTIGKNCKTNAHPFEILDEDGSCLVVGAHNGTLKNKHVLEDHQRFGTDSEALYNQIALTGIEDAISKVEGAWALTYYDHVEEEFRVVRNKERPLFYAWSEDKHTLFWASEVWMLRIATSRADIKLFEDKVHSFAEDTLYRFPAPMKLNDEITVERKGGLVGKQAPAFFQGRWTGGRTGQQTNAPQSQTTPAAGSQTPNNNSGSVTPNPLLANPTPLPPSSTTPLHLPTSTSASGTQTSSSGVKPPLTKGTLSTKPLSDVTAADNNVSNISSAKKFKGFNGVALSFGELKNQLDSGCGWCEMEHISVDDRFAWLAPSKPICKKCLDGSHPDMEGPSSSVSVH